MSWAQTVMQIVTTIAFVGGMYLIFDRKRAQRLPEYQAPHLEQFARMAVQSVEYENPALSIPAKKQAAITRTVSMFTMHDLPVPKEPAISIAVSACMWAVSDNPQKSSE